MADLKRFHEAQQKTVQGYEQAKKEIEAGRKTTHWIWYVLPQLKMLGVSEESKKYGIVDFEEACNYFRDPILFKNYIEITSLVERHLTKNPTLPLSTLMGSPTDANKIISSLTLFKRVAAYLQFIEGDSGHHLQKFQDSCDKIFNVILSQGYTPCITTESYLASCSIPEPQTSVHPQKRNIPEKPLESFLEPEPVKSSPSINPDKVSPNPTITSPVHQPEPLQSPDFIKSSSLSSEEHHHRNKTSLFRPHVTKSELVEETYSINSISTMVQELDSYIETRENEWSFHYNFLGLVSLIYWIQDKITGTDYFNTKNREVKIEAASKLKQILDPMLPQPDHPLTVAEKAALSDGRLGTLVAKHGGLAHLLENAPLKLHASRATL